MKEKKKQSKDFYETTITKEIITPPPSVTAEVYIIFLVINLFSALLDMSYIIQKVFEGTFRNPLRISVCITVFKRIASLFFI